MKKGMCTSYVQPCPAMSSYVQPFLACVCVCENSSVCACKKLFWVSAKILHRQFQREHHVLWSEHQKERQKEHQEDMGQLCLCPPMFSFLQPCSTMSSYVKLHEQKFFTASSTENTTCSRVSTRNNARTNTRKKTGGYATAMSSYV